MAEANAERLITAADVRAWRNQWHSLPLNRRDQWPRGEDQWIAAHASNRLTISDDPESAEEAVVGRDADRGVGPGTG